MKSMPAFGRMLVATTALAAPAGVWTRQVLAADAAAAAPVPAPVLTAVRSGNHTNFGRIVFETNGSARYLLERTGDHVLVRFTSGQMLGPPPSLPRNVLDMKVDGAAIDLTLAPGASVHPARVGGRVVLDVFAPSDKQRATESAAAQPKPAAPPPPQLQQVPATSAAAAVPPQPQPAERTQVAVEPLRAPDPNTREIDEKSPLGRDVLPQREAPAVFTVRRVKLPPETEGAAFLVPFGAENGAAAFRAKDAYYVVFDERRTVDLAALRDDPAFGKVTAEVLPGGTAFRIPASGGLPPVLALTPQGWRIATVPGAPKQEPIVPAAAAGRLNLPMEAGAKVISMADPDTGATLLIGTQRRPGQETSAWRQTPEFILRPSLQGVIVEPLADYISMKPDKQGFVLASGIGPLMISPQTREVRALLDASTLKRRLALPNMPADALVRQTDRQFREAAALQPLSRGSARRAIAESLVALGFAAEAQSLLRFAAEQDPQEAASADMVALTAIAGLLAGRLNEADGLDDPRLNGTDDITFWRAIRQAMRDEGSPAAAAVFAGVSPLALMYPKPVAERILPLMIETMLMGGEIAPAAKLLDQRPQDASLAYARALRRQAEGDTDGALAMFDALTHGLDQFDRTRAAVHATELRLKLGRIGSAVAAEALDKLLYAWRGDDRELALRERIAELRAQTGAWRVALSMLRDAENDFPERARPIRDRLRDTFAAMIRNDTQQAIPPLEFVSMVDENADLLSKGGDLNIDQPLSERLLALDLPSRAEPLLSKLMAAASTGVAKARFGATLATLLSRERKDKEALATLDASETSDLPVEVAEQRVLIRAGAIARDGDRAAAIALLLKLGTASASAARAELEEQSNDWPAAERAWADHVDQSVPDTGKLDEAQTRSVLRLATAAARAGDDGGISALRTRYEGRLPPGSLADMFRLLTAEPIRSSKDIQRSKQELNLAASLPATLKALNAGASAR